MMLDRGYIDFEEQYFTIGTHTYRYRYDTKIQVIKLKYIIMTSYSDQIISTINVAIEK